MLVEISRVPKLVWPTGTPQKPPDGDGRTSARYEDHRWRGRSCGLAPVERQPDVRGGARVKVLDQHALVRRVRLPPPGPQITTGVDKRSLNIKPSHANGIVCGGGVRCP